MLKLLKKCKKVFGCDTNENMRPISYAIDETIESLYSRTNEYSLNNEKRGERIVVSLTSFPLRFPYLHLTIRSMLLQTVKPDELILYLDENVDIERIPQSLIELRKYGLQIVKRPENLKPHKKYYYAMKEHPEDIVITIDDDIIYPEGMIEELYRMHQRHPACVVATRAHRIVFKRSGEINKYNDWNWNWHMEDRPSMRLCATGTGGVLYPPNCMDKRLFDINLIQKLSPNNDDLWLKVMQVLAGTKVVLCNQKFNKERLLVPNSQEGTLNSSNVHKNFNDIYMKNLMDYFNLTIKDFAGGVLLLTPYAVNNYGTKLQAYAVQEFVGEYDDVEIISYSPSLWGKVVRKIESKMMKKYSDVKIESSRVGEVSDVLLESRKNAINSFNNRLKIQDCITGKSKLTQEAGMHNAVVCGSDQIWNPVNLPQRIYMLEFVPREVKRVSFAASFGVAVIPEKLKKTYKKRLSNIEYMSIREESGCEIVKQFGYQAFWSLDPTLVLDENNWIKLAEEGQRVVPDRPYIFCYFLGNHKFGRDMAKKIQKEIGDVIIINLPHFKQYVSFDDKFADVDMYNVGVEEFIALIKNAEVICTDSFHGSAFSIIFEKEFYCCERHHEDDTGNTNDRLYSILSLLDIRDRMCKKISDINTVNKIQYDVVKEVLNEKRKETRDYFGRILEQND